MRALRRPEKVFCFYHKGLYEISEPCGKCHQTRGISCAVYRQKCFTVQLAQAEEEFQKLSETMENREKKLSDTKEILGLLSTESDVDIKYRLDVIATLRMLNKSIDKCEENIRKLKENSTSIQKQLQLDELEKKCLGDWITPSAPTRKKSVGMRARIQDLVARKQTLLEKQITGKK